MLIINAIQKCRFLDILTVSYVFQTVFFSTVFFLVMIKGCTVSWQALKLAVKEEPYNLFFSDFDILLPK